MIGEIDFKKGKKKHRAALQESMQWQCSDREVEKLLNEMFPAEDQQPVASEKCRRLLYQVGARLGGKVKSYR